MRHRVKKKKLNRPHSQRLALMRGLARELFEHGTIITTTAKAKAVKPFVESIITKAKKAALYAKEINERSNGDPEIQALRSKNVALRREINRHFNDRKLVKKICDEIAVNYIDRNGGYTRIIKVGRRRGDAAELSILQLVETKSEENVEN
ncbi:MULTISPECIES: 50S ribosomal protein L17 [Kosmotoga]|uniref:Large ribosomal subunit protein bL17 n=1 Tax=Kosmotoga olearia (strain ATCC BAA-1733 / DSM 21960 / TBF 19.5.1) TaxID=521045 RepID=RL17_KOSOT|nr:MULTISPECIES: 50S ribosomal protein L17 [Kosmotoga]C5CGH3.1 RecName: Full=Large ribosomal subunit protein bL17; AltName: Full=50S ribosomal protein L17 [Kosmotoga olearia TBF 19.5.1]ACR80554.1 ribosomal protein L17 [Kosmotoga olearia TBF 19.5.1]OAA19423.1 50S ribosomal protein L17 [Kosmotoga sp. DU53]